MEDEDITDNDGAFEVTDAGIIGLERGLKVNLLELEHLELFVTFEIDKE